jgi:2-polyprenyl-3-methyl-5-hydroxy-6-metoxy-1,4-benzoquinol methylase
MQNYRDKPQDYFAHARTEILPLLPAQPQRVLEIGCGVGATLAWLKHSQGAQYTAGVEIAPDAAAVAQGQADAVLCMDFEREWLPDTWSRFDLILCLDVLEHMLDPWRIIDRLVTKHLASGGTLLVSLPNVRHYSVTAPLIFHGRWDYTDAGILDKTHIRFFTRQSAAQLLTHPGLCAPEFLAVNFNMRTRKGIFNMLTAGRFNEFVTYQHLLSAHGVY